MSLIESNVHAILNEQKSEEQIDSVNEKNVSVDSINGKKMSGISVNGKKREIYQLVVLDDEVDVV
jgi:hypothetical protein